MVGIAFQYSFYICNLFAFMLCPAEGPQPELTGDSSLVEAGEKEHEKLVYLRKKAMSNIATAPVILKRVNECLARINKIERNNVNIPSSFKRRKK
ncbi:hypothetical protein MA16_Dca028897 [Dendrobium catenatum]|uniref:Uncharacterized protein n=1 Tax=Dendrobium catenatum TaxID=906689 RepID=A0A2I0VCB4_9ASPA|nr:hypothetical protein MA16_Dca028897 [Dendrobium catenatum]